MGRKQEQEIIKLLDKHTHRVLSPTEFIWFWEQAHKIYGFMSMSKSMLSEYLQKRDILTTIEEDGKSNYPLCGIRDKNPDILDYAAAYSRSSYFSHYTAVSIHNLTLQIPKHIYMTNERKKYIRYNSQMTQENIDKAFSKQPRQTSNNRNLSRYSIHFINGQANRNLGVIPYKDDLFVTDLERTLIDITARPFYAGGVTQVLEAFINAKEKLDIEKMISYYKKMHFAYPYHQAIGFYLEKAEYPQESIAPFLQMEQCFKFYLSYNIRFKEFSPRWNLYYPRGV